MIASYEMALSKVRSKAACGISLSGNGSSLLLEVPYLRILYQWAHRPQQRSEAICDGSLRLQSHVRSAAADNCRVN